MSVKQSGVTTIQISLYLNNLALLVSIYSVQSESFYDFEITIFIIGINVDFILDYFQMKNHISISNKILTNF